MGNVFTKEPVPKVDIKQDQSPAVVYETFPSLNAYLFK